MVLLPTLGKPTIPQFNGTGAFLFLHRKMERVPNTSDRRPISMHYVLDFKLFTCILNSEAIRSLPDTVWVSSGLPGLQTARLSVTERLFRDSGTPGKRHSSMLTDNEIRKYDSPKNWPQKRLLLTDRGGLALDVTAEWSA